MIPFSLWNEKDAEETRAFLRRRMADLCILEGEFQLSSGETSGIYFDCKRATLDGFFLNALADWILEEVIPKLPESPDFVGGPTLGADPIAAAVAMRAAQAHDNAMEMMDQIPDKELRRLCKLEPEMSTREFREIADDFPVVPASGLIVRKERKAHGTRTMIENDPDEESRVLVVEDVITTGASIARACDALLAEGHAVAGIFALLDREAGGREALEKKYRAPVLPLFTMSDFPEAKEEQT